MALIVFAIFSCTPRSLSDKSITEQACCGEEGQIPPPPPDGVTGG